MGIEGIFSIRIVVADYYLQKPVTGLDPGYCEFRGKEIKKVPVVRIFGSTSDGQKTCMHVHGVFPYFYIPHDGKDADDVNKTIYQIASSLDKALNISLGQSNSPTQHVFKIQLVKGIPFYGFHCKEYQYLKIFMYHPKFVKRAANLLQNGAIMGKVLQPHECHVPYVQQFLMDYNLYPMSFLHIPSEIVKFRCTENEEMPHFTVSKNQVLDKMLVPKISTCSLEVDIGSKFILNRFQLLDKKSSQHTNPGIESIWLDERRRREKLSEHDDQIPPLELPKTQERIQAEPTESDIFYRTALQKKLQDAETTLDSTMLSQTSLAWSSDPNDTKRTFNLKKLLLKSVYPEECTADDVLTNASFIQDHLASGNAFDSSMAHAKKSRRSPSDQDFLDDTIVDEDLVMSLTQPGVDNHMNLSLQEEDFELLAVMQQLEENDESGGVDLDSSLAPLSQSKPFSLQTGESENLGIEAENDSDSDNDSLNYTMVMEDVDEILRLSGKNTISKTNALPQVDGGDDLLETPKRARRRSTIESPRSPRTPKSKLPPNRYAPLNLVNSKSLKKTVKTRISSTTAETDSDVISVSSGGEESVSKPVPKRLQSLRRNLAQTNLTKDEITIISSEESDIAENLVTPRRQTRSSRDLDKTHITCNLKTPRRKTNDKKVLKSYDSTTKKTPTSASKRELVRRQSKYKLLDAELQRVRTESTIEDTNELSDALASRLKNMYSWLNPIVDRHIEFDTGQSLIVESNKVLHENVTDSEELSTSKSNSKDITILNSSSMIVLDNVNEDVFTSKKIFNGTVKDLEQISMENSNNICNDKTAKSAKTKILIGTNEQNPKDDNEDISKIDKEEKLIQEDVTTPSTNVRRSIRLANNGSNPLTISVKKKKKYTRRAYSPSLMPSKSALEHDERYNIRPRPGPSHISTYCYYSPTHSGEENSLDKLLRYNGVESPQLFSEDSRKTFDFNITPEGGGTNSNDVVVIRLRDEPPSYEEVDRHALDYQIEEHVHQVPFYGDPNDVTSRKEVGHTVLSIRGNSLNDLEEFKSSVDGVKGINEMLKDKIVQMGGQQMLRNFKTTNAIREFLGSENPVVITPLMEPPSMKDAKIWLKAKEYVKLKEKPIEEDSPIKIRRQKTAMVVDANGEDVDEENKSMILTPVGDGSFIANSEEERGSCTPLNSKRSIKRRKSRGARLSLAKRFKRIAVLKDEDDERNKIKGSQESAKSSESICNDTLMAELDRSSFALNSYQGPSQNDLSFGLSAATLNNTYGFKVNLENLQQAKADVEYNHLTTLSLEVFVQTRDHLKPNPQFDPVLCLFYSIANSEPETNARPSEETGFIIVDECEQNSKLNGIDSRVLVKFVDSEIELFSELLLLCRRWDPDIYAGYEIEMGSWGYVIDRAKTLTLNIGPLLSRVPSEKFVDTVDEDKEQFTDLDFETKLCGRVLLDVWRLMRSEIALTSYTFENVMYHILHRRVPKHSHSDLTGWFMATKTRWIVLEYYLERVKGTLQLLDQLDLIGRTSEMAKLIGIQFYEVLSRGSQFRVESMMLRIAKPKNLVPISPSVQQRAHMRAPEYLAMILEPQSRFYADPLIVLDFQSLYPSMIMAYNYCFSTCLGRVEHLGSSTPFEFGASQLKISPTILKHLIEKDYITVSPCGAVFVKSAIREGILPTMMKEVLDTRQMVKQSMKIHKNNSALQRILHARQLGLKLMANVTYGYTAANFSGRMPCVEVGDSVVSKGRETLERAIKLVEATDKWRAKVVYGDTDSLFVLLPGRSKDEAFRIGEEIAEMVTADNPQPVKLKMEKVYLPCILQTKKRYVGYMYETPDQAEPVYDAKGIETVRRDGCPAVAKMLEKCLRILFETRDVSLVKKYVCRQFTKLLSGRANLQDLIFAKEFRGLNGYKPTACVPALELTRKWMQTDPRNIPRRGERVPFVITNGPPGVPLIRLVRSPHDVLADEGLKVNAIYYITKAIIPPLNRCFLLIGADVNEWFADLPRKVLATPAMSLGNELIESHATKTKKSQAAKKSTISQYFSSTNCIIDCGRQTKTGICQECLKDARKCVVILHEKIAKLDRSQKSTEMICKSCCGRMHNTDCQSLDCPVLYVLELKNRESKQIAFFNDLLIKYF